MKNSRKIKAIVVGIFVLGSIMVAAAGDLNPATSEKDLIRTSTGIPLSTPYFRGSTLRLTNWVCYADATGTTTQDLTDCVAAVVVGSTGSAVTYTGTIQVAAEGTFAVDITVPTNATLAQYIEVTLTDTGQSPNVSFTYPWYGITTKARLGE
jgi:hypothetical protein